MIYFGVKKWCQNRGQNVYGTWGIHKHSQAWLWNISPIVRQLFQNNEKTLFSVLYGLYPKAWDVYPMIWYIYSKLWYVHPMAWDIHLARRKKFFLRRQETMFQKRTQKPEVACLKAHCITHILLPHEENIFTSRCK